MRRENVGEAVTVPGRKTLMRRVLTAAHQRAGREVHELKTLAGLLVLTHEGGTSVMIAEGSKTRNPGGEERQPRYVQEDRVLIVNASSWEKPEENVEGRRDNEARRTTIAAAVRCLLDEQVPGGIGKYLPADVEPSYALESPRLAEATAAALLGRCADTQNQSSAGSNALARDLTEQARAALGRMRDQG